LAARRAGQPPAAQTELKVGLSAAGYTSLALLLAQDSGLLSARGLKGRHAAAAGLRMMSTRA